MLITFTPGSTLMLTVQRTLLMAGNAFVFLKAAFKIISLGLMIFYRETNRHLISLCFSGLASISPPCDNLGALENT